MSQDAEPSPLSKLLALLDQAVAANELPEELEEVIELDHEQQAAKLLELARDGSQATPLRAVAILSLNHLSFSFMLGNEEYAQALNEQLEQLLNDRMNPAAVRAAAVLVMQNNFTFTLEPPEVKNSDGRQAAQREGSLQKDSPLVAISSVKSLSPDSGAALLPNLIQYMQLGESPLVEAALECLEKVGPAAGAAIPAHLQLLQQPDHPHRYQLLRNLGAIRTRPELTVPFLQQIVKTPESDDFGIALSSLMQIVVHNDLDTTEYVAFLEKSLRENTGNDLQVILGAIYLLGVKARPIRPLVKLLDRHPDKSIARQARETLRAMRLPKKDAATD